MSKKNLNDIKIPSFDDLFTTEQQRQEENLEKVVQLDIDTIHDFKNHPFRVEEDADMQKLMDSIQESGVLMPVLVRPNKDGNGYEMISGHRRKYALSHLGRHKVDAIVRDIDDDQAIILMVDSNIHREHISPSEKGFAYKLKLEALKRSVGRPSKENVSQLGTQKRSDQLLAEESGDSRNQIQRYIRLTYLIEPLRDMVDGRNKDGITMALTPAVELSFLKTEQQEDVSNLISSTFHTPSLGQAQQLKRLSQQGQWNLVQINQMLAQNKPNQKEKLSFGMDEIDTYFPKTYTPRQKKEVIVKLLVNWQKKREQQR